MPVTAAFGLRLAFAVILVGCQPAPVGLDVDGATEFDELRWHWGDLHAHSAWSFDGCENPALDCIHDAAGPASAFFGRAEERGLDFVALTDHAEPDLYRFASDELHEAGGTLAIWQGQQLNVVQAEGGTVVPLLGYEWTANHTSVQTRGPGTHRTVLLGASTACPSYRVAGRSLPADGHVPEVGERAFLQDDREIISSPFELWRALDAALLDPDCEPVSWLSFAHHPAYSNPQQTDWSDADNAPLREELVEIHSEHGSSECFDPDADGCGFALNDDQGYVPRGSVQAALDRGFVLGFVGGTDSHDSHPGSVDDGPSKVAQWSDEAPYDLIQHFTPGGLTGVFAPEGLDRDSLFDALRRRRTMASSGPRMEAYAWAVGRDGARYLPGELIPRWNMPVGLVLVLGDMDERGTHRWEDFEDVVIERVAAGGQVVSFGSGEAFGDSWNPDPSERWTYLRVRLLRGEASTGHPSLLGEERIWLSPWFTDAPPSCASAGGRASPWPLLGLLFAYRTKRTRATASQARASAAGPAQAQRGG